MNQKLKDSILLLLQHARDLDCLDQKGLVKISKVMMDNWSEE